VARRATVVFAALAAADTLLAAAGHDRPRWLTKPLLMPVLMAGRDRPAQRALALGGVGDVALLGRGEIAFTAGLVSFLAGHVAWISALRQRPGGGRPPAVRCSWRRTRCWRWRSSATCGCPPTRAW
jgi:uncharacterized membrane protein YhhN